MVNFQKKVVIKKNYDNLHLLLEKFIVHNMNTPHKQGIMVLKDNYAHVIPNLT